MNAMTYGEARAYVKQLGKSGSVMGLENIRSLMGRLGDVQEQLSVIHIAGTNGKGSVGAFLASALRQAGFRVGRYTSPAVFDPLEVWQINGTSITEEDYALLLSEVKCACMAMAEEGMPQPTVFEVETAVAFLYFYREKCDYVLLETGMGGETDATNVISRPVCSVITSVSMDHMNFLGNSLREIARAKAGIIKRGSAAAVLRQKPEVMEVMEETAAKMGAPLIVADRAEWVGRVRSSAEECVYQCRGIGELRLGLTGLCQIENSLLAAVVLKEILHIPARFIREGFAGTVWRGRFEILRKSPYFIIDGAHNEDAAEKLRLTLQNYFTNRKITYIIGVLADKEHEKMLRRMLPLAECVYTVTPDNPRALDAATLAEEARRFCDRVKACARVEDAVGEALAATAEDGVIVAFGSLTYLNEVRLALGNRVPGDADGESGGGKA